MGRIEDKEDVCIITSFDEWLNVLRDKGMISQERISSILKGLSHEEPLFRKTYNHIVKIDEQRCELMYQKTKLEDDIKRLKRRK